MTATSNYDLTDQPISVSSSPARRVLDLLLAIPATLALLPVFALIALWIKRDSRGPVFFLQERIGRGGQPFRIFKFRTMVVDAEQRGAQITIGRDPRITRSGHFLRRYRFDELPQLFNVLKGEMSIVGPRPEVPRYVAFYNNEQRQVLAYRPGLTSPASIAFSNESELLAQPPALNDPEYFYRTELMPAKISLDLQYSLQATVWSDCLVIAKTAVRLFG
ncbi:MAG TPA: sugar transferase [Blastocatellia bacterium]|nr:sugar transferase [Blastocatellia bacterium]HMZ20824.1 sugar transferase [Blastocatellia bacterium]